MAFGTKSTKTFNLTAENSWAPLISILVFYVDELGVVVNDALTVPIQPALDDKVIVLNLSLRPCFCLVFINSVLDHRILNVKTFSFRI